MRPRYVQVVPERVRHLQPTDRPEGRSRCRSIGGHGGCARSTARHVRSGSRRSIAIAAASAGPIHAGSSRWSPLASSSSSTGRYAPGSTPMAMTRISCTAHLPSPPPGSPAPASHEPGARRCHSHPRYADTGHDVARHDNPVPRDRERCTPTPPAVYRPLPSYRYQVQPVPPGPHASIMPGFRRRGGGRYVRVRACLKSRPAGCTSGSPPRRGVPGWAGGPLVAAADQSDPHRTSGWGPRSGGARGDPPRCGLPDGESGCRLRGRVLTAARSPPLPAVGGASLAWAPH